MMALKLFSVAPLALAPVSAMHLMRSPFSSAMRDDAICKDDARLTFLQKQLYYSNLKGYGPHSSEPSGMLISNVFPVESSTEPADLLITTVQAYYPFNVSQNAIVGDIAQISMAAGSSAYFQMTLLDRVTRLPITGEIAPFGLTFFNFKELAVEGCTGYELADNTHVEATVESHTKFSFTSTSGKVAPKHAFELTDDEKASAVFLRCHEPVVGVEASVRAGHGGESLYVTGPTNVFCPKRTTCTGFLCPEWYTPRHDIGDHYCASDECDMSDYTECCAPSVPSQCLKKYTLMFPKNSLLYTNLGGAGPDSQKPEGMRFKNVFPDTGTTIDMIINAESEVDCVNASMHALNPASCLSTSNGMHGQFGRITVSAGNYVDLRVSFVLHDTDEVAPIEHGFYFTVYDFDQQRDGGGKETVRLSGFRSYSVSNTSSIVIEDEGGLYHRGIFSSNVVGTEEDNPKNPSKLTQDQVDKSISFSFPPNSSGFNLTLGVGEGWAARNFEFTGYSILPCPAQAQCSTLSCPPGWASKLDADFMLCEEPECNVQNDIETCCANQDHSALATCASMLCPQGSVIRESAATEPCAELPCSDRDIDTCCMASESSSHMCGEPQRLVLANVVNTWVGAGDVQVRYSDVFPYLNRTIDLKIRFSGVPTDLTSDNAPTITGSVVRVLLDEASIRGVGVEFRFIEPEDGADVQDMPEFYLTLFAGSVGMDSIPRHLTLWSDGVKKLSLPESSELVYQGNASFDLGIFSVADVSRFESMNMFALDPKAMRNGVTVLLNSSLLRLHIATGHHTAADLDTDFSLSRIRGLTTHADPGDSSSTPHASGVLFFGGASSMTCNARAKCASHQCPSGFTQRANATSLVCNGELCGPDDDFTCCDCDHQAAMILDSGRVQSSKLGELTDPGYERVMLIRDVFPFWQRVNLRVKSLNEYFAGNASLNRVDGGFMNINIASGSSTTFLFAFVNDDGAMVRVPFHFIFSVFDIDQQDDGGAQESIEVGKSMWAAMSKESLVVSETVDGMQEFHSVENGMGWDNPSDPLHLNDYHLTNSVSFMMDEDIEKFNVTLRVRAGFAARNFLFAGQSNMLCSRKQVCENYRCPVGKVLVSDAALRTCLAAVCTALDETQCCSDDNLDDEPPQAARPAVRDP